MERHLDRRGGLEQLGKSSQGRQVRCPRRGKGEETAVLDQKQIVLTNPESEALEVERPIADAPDKRVRVLSLPDGLGERAQVIGEVARLLVC